MIYSCTCVRVRAKCISCLNFDWSNSLKLSCSSKCSRESLGRSNIRLLTRLGKTPRIFETKFAIAARDVQGSANMCVPDLVLDFVRDSIRSYVRGTRCPELASFIDQHKESVEGIVLCGVSVRAIVHTGKFKAPVCSQHLSAWKVFNKKRVFLLLKSIFYRLVKPYPDTFYQNKIMFSASI